jgi:hypothetical protein
MRSESPRSLLVGLWRFDKPRTIAACKPRQPLSRAQIRDLFKHAEEIRVRFTRTHRTLSFQSALDRCPYDVLDMREATARSPPRITIAYQLPHGKYRYTISFDSPDTFFMGSPGRREYFRRIPAGKSS